MDPMTYSEKRSRQLLEERLESIISAAALMADADCTRDERRERIVAECNAVRQALQDLLSEYMSNVSLLKCALKFQKCLLICIFIRWDKRKIVPGLIEPLIKCVEKQEIYVVNCEKL